MITELLFAQAINLPHVGVGSGGSTLQTVLNVVLGVIGAITVLVIVLAGFQLVVSSGEPAKVATARQTILYAVVGLVVVIFASTIVNFVLNGVFK